MPGTLFGPGHYASRKGNHHRGGAGLSGRGHSTTDPGLGKHADRFGDLAGAALVAGLFPGLAITITVLAFNLLGDGMRDTLDPHLRGNHGSGG